MYVLHPIVNIGSGHADTAAKRHCNRLLQDFISIENYSTLTCYSLVSIRVYSFRKRYIVSIL